MCTGLEIAALVAAVGGTTAAAAGQSAQVRNNAHAQNKQTQFSAGEFNVRDQLARQIFGENTEINRATYDELNALDDQSFAERTGLSKAAFGQLNQIERDQIVRDAAASDANISGSRDIRVARDAEQDAARAEEYTGRDNARVEYERTLADANRTQTGFRDRADAVAQELIQAFSPEAMAGRRTGAAASRNDLVSRATSPAAPAAPAGNMDPRLRAAFERYSASGRAAAGERSGAISQVASHSDALGAGDRAIDSGNERVGFITDDAKRAIAPLSAKLDVSSLRFNNAGAHGRARYDTATANARDRRTGVDADLESALGLSSTRAQGEARPVVAYTGAADDALANFFSGRSESAAGRGNTLIGANDARLQGSAAVSQNLENGMSGITQFRMANQGPNARSTLGQFASAVTPALFSVAANGPSSTGFGLRRTPAPPSITT